MYPYFQLSTWGNRRDLVSWEDHLEAVNIPHAVTADSVVRDGCTVTEYCLWRMGMENQNDRTICNQTPIKGDIIKTWGGFKFNEED